MELDALFSSLADQTRRDILERVVVKEQTVSEIAARYKTSLVAISKHISVLERAHLVRRRRQGREHYISAEPTALKAVQDYLEDYRALWETRFDALERYVKNKEK